MNNSSSQLLYKLNQSYKDNTILQKELHHVKSEYGELLLRDSDNSRQLTEYMAELRRLTEESEWKIREWSELRIENKVLKENYETAKKEVERIMKENRKLKLEKEVIFDAANVKFKGFEKRVVALETNLAAVKHRFTLGGQRETVKNAHPAQETTQNLSSEQNSGPKPQLSFGSNGKQEGLVRCQTGYKTMPPILEKTGFSKPFTDTKTTSTLPICISDSDDEDEPKGFKRKLDVADAFDNFKTPVTVPKHWEYEAHMVAELEKNTELCLKAVCVLYKQHTTAGKPKGFRDIDAFSGMVLGKFLVDGDEHGRLKKSAADLKEYITDGPSRCRSIAISHSTKLFEIYKNKEDPHFSPLN